MSNCLFRNYENPALCSPLNPAYIGLHGTNGKGGRVANANVPADYNGVLLSDSPVRGDQTKIYDKLDKYAASYDKQFEDVKQAELAKGKTDNEAQIKSLYLWSKSPGTGKTTTAAALLNEYLLKHYVGALKRGQNPAQRPVYFLDANLLQTEYTTFTRPRVPDDIAEPASRRYYRAMELGKHTEFVVIDDIATRDASEPFRTDLHSVINHRVANKMPTVYTSNIPVEELSDVFKDDRLPDRIRHMTQEIHFPGESKRGK